jgi:hypothetical protein
MIQITHPKKIKAGDELINLGLKVSDIKQKTRLTFNWGDDNIKVIGANMVSPNIFEFAPVKRENNWYIKYCASQDAKPATKRLYVTVETIQTRKILIWIMRGIGILFLLLPVIVLIGQMYFEGRLSNYFNLSINLGSLSLSVPVMFIITIFLWSRKFTEYISRIMSVSEKAAKTEIIEREGKGMSYIPIKILDQNSNDSDDNLDTNFSDWITIKPYWKKSEIN